MEINTRVWNYRHHREGDVWVWELFQPAPYSGHGGGGNTITQSLAKGLPYQTGVGAEY